MLEVVFISAVQPATRLHRVLREKDVTGTELGAYLGVVSQTAGIVASLSDLRYDIWTDGACANKTSGAGGYAAVLFARRSDGIVERWEVSGGAFQPAHDGPQDVRRVAKVGATGAVADGEEGHRRGGVGEAAVRKSGHEGRARGGRRLARLVRPPDPGPLQDLQGGRAGDRQLTVGGPDDAGPHGQGAAGDGGDVQKVEGHAAPDHVHDGVHGTDLVKRYVFGVYVVDRARYVLEGNPDRRINDPEVQKSYYYCGTGLIAQNVYLFAASQGLAAWFHNCDKENTAREFKLRPEQSVLFAQTVGYPAA